MLPVFSCGYLRVFFSSWRGNKRESARRRSVELLQRVAGGNTRGNPPELQRRTSRQSHRRTPRDQARARDNLLHHATTQRERERERERQRASTTQHDTRTDTPRDRGTGTRCPALLGLAPRQFRSREELQLSPQLELRTRALCLTRTSISDKLLLFLSRDSHVLGFCQRLRAAMALARSEKWAACCGTCAEWSANEFMTNRIVSGDASTVCMTCIDIDWCCLGGCLVRLCRLGIKD